MFAKEPDAEVFKKEFGENSCTPAKEARAITGLNGKGAPISRKKITVFQIDAVGTVFDSRY